MTLTCTTRLRVRCAVFATGDKKAIADVVASLQKELLLRVTGELSEDQEAIFLGRLMQRTSTSVEMFMETSHIDCILEQASGKTCRAAPTPGTDALKKGKAKLAEALLPEEHQQCRKPVGQLLGLCNLRMDVMCAVRELSRGIAAPTMDQRAKRKHLLRCLGGSKNYAQEICPKLRLSEKRSSLDVQSYVGNDWAGDPNTGHSTSGVATYLLGVNLQSNSRTQQTIGLSRREAELYAIGAGAVDSLVIR